MMYVRESTIVGYAYMAELWCESCMETLCEGDGEFKPADSETMLDEIASILGVDRQDEYTFDSDDFPKIVTLGHLDFHSNEDLDVCGECGEGLGA